jgi:hypothetical protein
MLSVYIPRYLASQSHAPRAPIVHHNEGDLIFGSDKVAIERCWLAEE